MSILRRLSTSALWNPIALGITLIGCVAALAFSAKVTLGSYRSRPVAQPIDFDHELHARRNATCDVCHRSYETSQAAGFPGIAVCADCHDIEEDPISDGPEEARLRDMIEKGQELRWVRLHAIDQEIRFSHAIHAGKHHVPCTRCHGAVEKWTSPLAREVDPFFEMDDCRDCHEESGATNDCLACHR